MDSPSPSLVARANAANLGSSLVAEQIRALHNRIDSESLQTQNNITNTWRSCCFTIDRRVLMYFTQISIIGICIIFSIVQLILGAEPSNFYVCLLSSSVGYLLPSPSLNFKENIAPSLVGFSPSEARRENATPT